MGKKFKKFKQAEKTTGQYSQGGSHKEVPIWPTIYQKTTETEDVVTDTPKPVYRFVYKWTFTINWAEVILWTIILMSLYLLH